MKRDFETAHPPAPQPDEPDASVDVRLFASWLGLALVGFGTAMAAYMFYRVGEVVLDPRTFETQVDRWEFVIRGRTSDMFPEAYETPERTIIAAPVTTGDPSIEPVSPPPPENATRDQTEEMARFVGRVGSKSARPAALLLIILVLTILVRIAIAIIHAGIRLAGLAGGEREYMKRIIEELVHQRKHPGD